MTAIVLALATAPRTRIAFTPTGRTDRPRPIDHKDQPGRGDPAKSTHGSVARQPTDTDPNQSLSNPAAAEEPPARLRPLARPFRPRPRRPPGGPTRAESTSKARCGYRTIMAKSGQPWRPRPPHNCSSSRNKPKVNGSNTNPITQRTRTNPLAKGQHRTHCKRARTNPLLPSYRVLARGSRPPIHGVAQALSLPSRDPSRLRSSRRRPSALRPRRSTTSRRFEPNEPNGKVARTKPIMHWVTTNPNRRVHNKANLQVPRRTQSGVGAATNHGSRITRPSPTPGSDVRMPAATQPQPAIGIVWRSVARGPGKGRLRPSLGAAFSGGQAAKLVPTQWRLALEAV